MTTGASAPVPGIKRISVKFGYTTDSGARLTWDAASHRKESTPDLKKTVSVQRCESDKVVISSVMELARIAAVAEYPKEVMLAAVEAGYKRVADWRAKQPK